jgi:hypothetical protein
MQQAKCQDCAKRGAFIDKTSFTILTGKQHGYSLKLLILAVMNARGKFILVKIVSLL